MTRNVTSLFGGEVAPSGQPVPEVVAFLENLLDRAKSGDIRAIAVAYVKDNGKTSAGWERERNDDNRLACVLHSAIACLMGKFTERLTNAGVEVANPADRGAS
jgi:hypothetical protein